MNVGTVGSNIQGAANKRLEKYCAILDDYSSSSGAIHNPFIIVNQNDGVDKVEFLKKKCKAIEEQKEIIGSKTDKTFKEISKLSDEAMHELDIATSEAEKFYKSKQEEVKRATLSIINDYQTSGGNISEQEARSRLLSVMGNINLTMPSTLKGKIDSAALKMSSLSLKIEDLSSLTFMDEQLTSSLNANNLDIAKIQTLLGINIASTNFVNPISAGRFFLNASSSISSNIGSIMSRMQLGNELTKKSIQKQMDSKPTEISTNNTLY